MSTGGLTEILICARQNYVICGSSCPPLAQTTQITGDVTVGSSSAISTRVRIKEKN